VVSRGFAWVCVDSRRRASILRGSCVRGRLGHALDDDFHGTSGWLSHFRSELARLDADAVNQAMRRHVVAGPLHIAIVAPDAYAVKQALLAPTAPPRTYSSAKPEALLAEDRLVEAFDLGLDEESVRIVPAAELFSR
jgi:zinc protease